MSKEFIRRRVKIVSFFNIGVVEEVGVEVNLWGCRG